MKTVKILLSVAAILSVLSTNAQTQREGKSSCGIIRVITTKKSSNGVPKNLISYKDSITGKIITPATFDFGRAFSNNFAIVGKYDENHKLLRGAINRKGEMMFGYKYSKIKDFDKYGHAIATIGNRESKKMDIIDTLGRMLTQSQYDVIKDFSCGLAAVGVGQWEKDGSATIANNYQLKGKFGYIDHNLKVAIPLVYDDAKEFVNGYAAVGQMGKYYIRWGVIDKSGNQIIPFKYYSLSVNYNKRCLVSKVVEGKLKYGFIDMQGNEITPCAYDNCQNYKNGYAWVGTNESDGIIRYAMIDDTGKHIMDNLYNIILTTPRLTIAAKADNSRRLRFGVILDNCNELIGFEYDDIFIWSDTTDKGSKTEYRARLTNNGTEQVITLEF